MRKVNRQLISCPARLQNISAENLLHLQDHSKILSSIYAHDDVKNSLKQLYFDKCYICECDVSDGKFAVDHYKPKKQFPGLGYTWENLHKICEKCNLAKEKKIFFFVHNNSITDIKLLDPSSSVYNIDDYLKYNVNSLAESANIGNDPIILEKSRVTIDYLNGDIDSEYCKNLPYRRSIRVNKFLKFCMNELTIHKTRILELKMNIEEYLPPENFEELAIDQHICFKLNNVDEVYLSERAKFSTCTRVNLYPTLGITYSELRKIVNKLKTILGI